MEPETVSVFLSRAEAMVLFEFLARCDDMRNLRVEHPSEQTMLWVLEGQLEKQLREVLDPNYRELVEAARQEVVRTR